MDIPNEVALNQSAAIALCSNPFLHYIWRKQLFQPDINHRQKLGEFIAANKNIVQEKVQKFRPLTDEWITNKIAATTEKGLVGMTIADVREIEQWVDEQLAKI
jgi:hypothetical protein